jgi:hypothetical protein
MEFIDEFKKACGEVARRIDRSELRASEEVPTYIAERLWVEAVTSLELQMGTDEADRLVWENLEATKAICREVAEELVAEWEEVCHG